MAYTNVEGRQQLLDQIAIATDQLGSALAALGEAYERLDEYAAERLEEQLFRPVQAAYGRAKRSHTEFAERHGLSVRAYGQNSPGAVRSAKVAIEDAVAAVREADATLATLQDSMLPVEVGDAELRAELAHVREQLGHVPGRSRELVRTLGR